MNDEIDTTVTLMDVGKKVGNDIQCKWIITHKRVRGRREEGGLKRMTVVGSDEKQ